MLRKSVTQESLSFHLTLLNHYVTVITIQQQKGYTNMNTNAHPFTNVTSEVKMISPDEAQDILNSIPADKLEFRDPQRVDKILNSWRLHGEAPLPVIMFVNGFPTYQHILYAIADFNHSVPCFCIYNFPTRQETYKFPAPVKVAPVVPSKAFLTEEEAKVIWPDMLNFKSVRTLCQAVEFGYGSVNRKYSKDDVVKAISNHRDIADIILDNVCHNGPARNSYNLAPFARALKKYPSRTAEILRAVKCFSKMLEAKTKGEKVPRIYQETYMNTFEDYCEWHVEMKDKLDGSEMKQKASLYCATALKAFLDKETSICDFRYTVIIKDPFQINLPAEPKQDDLFQGSKR
jgi:hypothetical protein